MGLWNRMRQHRQQRLTDETNLETFGYLDEAEPRVEHEPTDLFERVFTPEQRRYVAEETAELAMWSLVEPHVGESPGPGLGRRRTLRREIRRIALAALYARTPPPRPVFVISPYGRSGSTLFADYLGQLIPMRGEVLNRNTVAGIRKSASKTAALRHIAARLARASDVLAGCKLLLVQMAMHQITFADLRTRFPDAIYIVIYRRSAFRQYLSNQVARHTLWWSSRGEPFTGTIRLDPDEVAAHIDEYRAVHQHLGCVLSDALFVSYEDLVRDPQRVMRETVCAHLGVPFHPVETTLRKRISRPPHEVVENWDDVAHLADENLGRSLSC